VSIRGGTILLRRALAPLSDGPSGIFGPDEIDGLLAFFDANGYASLRGAFDESELTRAEAELADAQGRVADGSLDARHATSILDDPGATIEGRRFAHYVCFATRAAASADALVHHPALVGVAAGILGPHAWLLDYEQFGVVYQDARPDPGTGYSRIGWHTDHQSGPHLDIWPGVAFTIHFDPTSPANGFLRVRPGSHLGGVAGMPPAFERVPEEMGLYQERGDVLFHHADLWHAAARGTADGRAAIRRHLRGSWHGGAKLDVGHGTEDFVKNARR
jgi:ectoine hydroxylase-related dioxygenase (phytanoyl-CoA dioxygenase family)